MLSGFQLLFNRLDDRISDVIEDGVEHGAFFKRVTLPRLVGGAGQLVRPVRERFVPVTSATDLAVVKTVRERLRPKDEPPMATPGPTRVDLHSALIHRPTQRRGRRCPEHLTPAPSAAPGHLGSTPTGGEQHEHVRRCHLDGARPVPEH